MIFKTGDTYQHQFNVSKEVYGGFIHTFNDNNPLHTDDEFAQERGFKGRVMHGNILNGFLSYFIGECLPEKNVIIHTQEIQYKNPVYLNDIINFTSTIDDISEAVNTINFKFTFRNAEEKVVAKGKIQIGLLK